MDSSNPYGNFAPSLRHKFTAMFSFLTISRHFFKRGEISTVKELFYYYLGAAQDMGVPTTGKARNLTHVVWMEP